MRRIQSSATPARRAATAGRHAVIAAALVLGIGGCDTLLEVDNPNNVLQEDLETPEGVTALVNGALSNTAQALSDVIRAHAALTDEFRWVGSQNGVGELDRGELSNTSNEYMGDPFNELSVARWSADEAIRMIEGFEAEGQAIDENDLGRAYFYSGINYAMIADMFDDFTFSNRQEAGPPVGEENMHTVYDTAIERFNTAIALFQETNDAELELAALAMRARARWAKALWGKLNPNGSVDTADPLINDADANADAEAILAMISDPDWMYRFNFSAGTIDNGVAGFINSRLEMVVNSEYAKADESGKKICSPSNEDCEENGILVLDPIDGIKDPALSGILFEFIDGYVYSPLTVVSARELHLILAEAALAQSGTASPDFVTHINAVRALVQVPEDEDGLTPYDPAVHTGIDPQALLEHERFVNLFLQAQRRLADMYRFGETSPQWIPLGEAVTTPGTFFLIPDGERFSNCYILGSC